MCTMKVTPNNVSGVEQFIPINVTDDKRPKRLRKRLKSNRPEWVIRTPDGVYAHYKAIISTAPVGGVPH